MKNLLFILLFALGFIPCKLNAQFNLNVSIGSQPAWGPSGYERAEYYYMPDIESYYDVPKRQFIYISNGRWTFSSSLPSKYRGYDLYNGYKVVINSPEPYYHFREHRVKYAKYKSRHSKRAIRHERYDDDDDERYVKYERRNRDRGESRRHGHKRHHHDDD